MSAVIVEFLPNVMSFVICDGQRLVVWTIGPDGEPIEDIEATTHHCIMADGANDVATVIPHWHQLARTYAVLFTTRENARQSADHFAGLADTRGPPVLV